MTALLYCIEGKNKARDAVKHRSEPIDMKSLKRGWKLITGR
jgi:hypothetical protein